jgi:hypothetical protein
MDHQADLHIAEAPTVWALARARDQVRSLCARIAAALERHAERLGAAVLYEELSKLSDAELERRGIPRGELHRCVDP